MSPEEEVERLLKKWIPASPYALKAYIVGGYVRDEILGLEGKDIDLVVEKLGGAKELSHWLHEQAPAVITRPHELGAGYPIWQVVFKGNIEHAGETFQTLGCEIEIADTQAECFPDPQSRQRVTVYGDLPEDCKRRDFTTNMLYRDLTTGALVDPSGQGEHDIRAGILRGHPEVKLEKIFSDDPLRMLRLFRFHCRFGWQIPADVLACVRACRERTAILSAERIRDEIIKMGDTGRLYLALKLMEETGVLELVFPELMPMIGCTQDKIYHAEGDVWTHTLLVLKNAPANWKMQLAALFHDAGKPATRSVHGDRIKFLGHEMISDEIAEKVLKRLHFDAASTKEIRTLVRHHMRGSDVENWSTLKPARKLIRDVEDQMENLIMLIEADSKSALDKDGNVRLSHIQQLRDAIARAKEIPMLPKCILSGHEIMSVLGIPTGKQVAEVKTFLQNLEDEAAEKKHVLTKQEAIDAILAEFGRGDRS